MQVKVNRTFATANKRYKRGTYVDVPQDTVQALKARGLVSDVSEHTEQSDPEAESRSTRVVGPTRQYSDDEEDEAAPDEGVTFACPHCGRQYSTDRGYKRHIETKHE